MTIKNLDQSKLRFILFKYALFKGGSTALISQLILHITGQRDFFDGIVLSLIIMPFCFLFLGLYEWNKKQKGIKNKD